MSPQPQQAFPNSSQILFKKLCLGFVLGHFHENHLASLTIIGFTKQKNGYPDTCAGQNDGKVNFKIPSFGDDAGEYKKRGAPPLSTDDRGIEKTHFDLRTFAKLVGALLLQLCRFGSAVIAIVVVLACGEAARSVLGG